MLSIKCRNEEKINKYINIGEWEEEKRPKREQKTECNGNALSLSWCMVREKESAGVGD